MEVGVRLGWRRGGGKGEVTKVGDENRRGECGWTGSRTTSSDAACSRCQ